MRRLTPLLITVAVIGGRVRRCLRASVGSISFGATYPRHVSLARLKIGTRGDKSKEQEQERIKIMNHDQ